MTMSVLDPAAALVALAAVSVMMFAALAVITGAVEDWWYAIVGAHVRLWSLLAGLMARLVRRGRLVDRR